MKKQERVSSDMALRLQLARQHADLTQEELAEKAGVGLSTIQRIEQGSRGGSTTTFVKLANALNIPVEYLLYGKEGKPPARRVLIPDNLTVQDVTLIEEFIGFLSEKQKRKITSPNTEKRLQERAESGNNEDQKPDNVTG